jgi:hypothetical protein
LRLKLMKCPTPQKTLWYRIFSSYNKESVFRYAFYFGFNAEEQRKNLVAVAKSVEAHNREYNEVVGNNPHLKPTESENRYHPIPSSKLMFMVHSKKMAIQGLGLYDQKRCRISWSSRGWKSRMGGTHSIS